MITFAKIILVAAATLTFTAKVLAADSATAQEASAMVKQGVAFLKANGKDKFLTEVVNPKGKFVDRDLYITVWDANANVLAHGANPKMVGKALIDLKDADDKSFMKEIVAKAASSPGGAWVDYKWVNPLSKNIQAKSAYFERVDDIIISSGYYKK